MSLLIDAASTRIVLAKGYTLPDDPDAVAYITAVEAADTAAGTPGGLEPPTRMAINSFFKGCKADGIWPAIKASCILAGAQTLSGALVPLLPTMPAPTNNGFIGIGTDYVRKTGLVGNGTTKYLDTNRAENADPQNNVHISAYITGAFSSGQQILCGLDNINAVDLYCPFLSGLAIYNRSSSPVFTGTAGTVGFAGTTRSLSSSASYRAFGSFGSVARVSQGSNTTKYNLFRSPSYPSAYYGSGRIAFYSIGESLDLALLDTRVTALINAINVAF